MGGVGSGVRKDGLPRQRIKPYVRGFNAPGRDVSERRITGARIGFRRYINGQACDFNYTKWLRMLTLREVAVILRMSVKWLRKKIKAGEIQASKFGCQYFVSSREVMRVAGEYGLKQFPIPTSAPVIARTRKRVQAKVYDPEAEAGTPEARGVEGSAGAGCDPFAGEAADHSDHGAMPSPPGDHLPDGWILREVLPGEHPIERQDD